MFKFLAMNLGKILGVMIGLWTIPEYMQDTPINRVTVLLIIAACTYTGHKVDNWYKNHLESQQAN